jgi:hypothetical protein
MKPVDFDDLFAREGDARSTLTGPARESDPAMEALWMVADALRVLGGTQCELEAAIHWRLRDALDLLAHGERRQSGQPIPREPYETLERFESLL